MNGEKCDFCEHDRGPLVEQPEQCAECKGYSNFQEKVQMHPKQAYDYHVFMDEKKKNNKIKFILNGCDISFIAEAPADITLEQLLKQCDKIKPDWCACGICSYAEMFPSYDYPTEIEIGYDSIRKTSEDVSCRIVEEK